MTEVTDRGSREVVAERLLTASARHAMDPQVKITWDTEPEAGKWWMPPEWTSLYGTDLWESLGEDRQRKLVLHEFCSLTSAGIWFEAILMQLLLRQMFKRGTVDAHMRYALKEVEEECRHSLMFARMVDQIGGQEYAPGRLSTFVLNWYTSLAPAPAAYAATLVAEELLDSGQRRLIDFDHVQALAKETARLHVVEEARHMQWAREEMARQVPELGFVSKRFLRLMMLVVTWTTMYNLRSPRIYASVGLPVRRTARVAKRNEHWRRTKIDTAARLVKFFEEQDIITPRGRKWWVRAGLAA